MLAKCRGIFQTVQQSQRLEEIEFDLARKSRVSVGLGGHSGGRGQRSKYITWAKEFRLQKQIPQ